MWCFYLAAFKISSSLFFDGLTTMWLCMVFSLSILSGACWTFSIYTHSSNLESFKYYFFKCIFYLIFLVSPSHSSITHVLDILILSHISLRLCGFFYNFYPPSSFYWIISMVLISSSLVLSSVISAFWLIQWFLLSDVIFKKL